MNTEKKQAVVFCTKHTVVDTVKTLVLDAVPVDLVNNVKMQGVLFSKNMS